MYPATIHERSVFMTSPIVGPWRVTLTIPDGPPPFLNLTTFLSDGVVLNAFPYPTPMPEGSDHKFEFFTTAVGAWKDVGGGNVKLTFETLGADESGKLVGSRLVTATVDVESDGSGFSGPFTVTMLDPARQQVGAFDGSVSASRIEA
jgi:hypothetical protein